MIGCADLQAFLCQNPFYLIGSQESASFQLSVGSRQLVHQNLQLRTDNFKLLIHNLYPLASNHNLLIFQLMPRFLLFLSFLATAIIVAAINRGFDFSDEGLYLLLTDPMQENYDGLFLYDLFFKLLHKLLGVEFGIQGLRLIRLLSMGIGALALVYFWKNIKMDSTLSLEIFLISFLGLLSGYSFLPPSLSYNSISVVLTCVWLALVIGAKHSRILLLAIALTLVFFAYIKLSAAVILFSLTCTLFGYRSRSFIQTFLYSTVLFIALEGLFYWAFQDGLILRAIHFVKLDTLRESYHWSNLLKSTLVGSFWSFVVFISFFFAAVASNSSFKLRNIVFLVAGVVFLGVVYITHITSEWPHVILLFTIAILGYLLGKRIPYKGMSGGKYLLILLVLPFILHFGSNVYWLRLGIHYWVFWILAILVLEGKSIFHFKSVFGLLSVSLVTYGIWLFPFEQSPLWNANQEWEYKPGKFIKITPEQKQLLQNLQSAMKEYPHSQVLALYRNPGMAYLAGYTIPMKPGFWEKSELDVYLINTSLELGIIYYPMDSIPQSILNQYRQTPVGSCQDEAVTWLWK